MKLDEVLKSEGLSCAIPYSQIGKMLKMITESADPEDSERALTFCGDGQELAFPTTVGVPEGVRPRKCPPGKQYIGDFHTHPTGIAKKSVGDWYADMEASKRIACVGAAEEQFTPEEEEPVYHRAVVCHIFSTNHPEYEDFRGRLMSASSLILDYEDMMEPMPTKDELDRYNLLKKALGMLVDEGKRKGIIGSCDKFSVLDVERMLEEQKVPPGFSNGKR